MFFWSTRFVLASHGIHAHCCVCAKLESRANTREQERLKVSSLIGTDVFVAGTYILLRLLLPLLLSRILWLHRPWKPVYASFFHVHTYPCSHHDARVLFVSFGPPSAT